MYKYRYWYSVLQSRYIFDRPRLRVFFSPAPAPASGSYKKEGFQPVWRIQNVLMRIRILLF